MSVKIRLTRIGRHKDPFYRIVAADSHFARDGRYIEQIGTYDPREGIEKAVIDEALALKWLNCGAIPSDSTKAILKDKGIMAKFGASKVKKGPSKKEDPKKAEPKKAAPKAAKPVEGAK